MAHLSADAIMDLLLEGTDPDWVLDEIRKLNQDKVDCPQKPKDCTAAEGLK